MELSENMETGNSRSPEVSSAALIHGYEKTKTECTARESGRLPEANVVGGVEKPKTETSDGDQSSKERRRRRRRGKYGRLKRVRLEALALPVADDTTGSESEKHFIVVDGPQVGIFRSAASCSTASDSRGRSWFGRKLKKRNRNSTPSTSKSPVTTMTMTMNSRQRCERYLKQFVALLFSTIGLLCLMVGYTVLGGYVFSQLESSNEVNVKADMRQVRQWHVNRLWTVTARLNVLDEKNWTKMANNLLKNLTREVFLSTNNKGFDGSSDADSAPRWNFAGALLYSVTVITTIGYGHIAPKTAAGMVVTIFYAIFGIPLTLLTITNLGRMLATAFRFLYCNVFIVCRCCKRPQQPETLPLNATTSGPDHELHQLDPDITDCGPEVVKATDDKDGDGGCSKPEVNVMVQWQDDVSAPQQRCPHNWHKLITDMDEIQKVHVPISVSFALMVGYIAVGALLFSYCEDWGYLVASYFCFVTLSTIGFGDYVPGTSLDASSSQEKMVLCALYLVFGLALLAMCFDLMQEEAKNKFRSIGRRLGLIEANE